MLPNADGELICVKKRFIFDLHRSNDDYSVSTSAQVSSSVSFGGDLWNFSGQSVNETASDDAARFALAPPLLAA